MRRILVVGGSGFTGGHAVPLLWKRYDEISCLVRSSSKVSHINLPGVKFELGDLTDRESLTAALRGKDTVVNIASLVGGSANKAVFAENIVAACKAAGTSRAIFVSSTSIFTTLPAESKSARLAAEAVVLNSELDYTILRPTMIYGGGGDRNMIRLIRFLRRSPLVFVPGSGELRQQPIHVDDLSCAIVACLEADTTIRKIYNLSGAEPITFNEVVDEICRALGIKRLKVHIPIGVALVTARLANRVIGRPLIKEEQILRLNEDKVFDHSAARGDFGFSPRAFSEGIRQEVAGS